MMTHNGKLKYRDFEQPVPKVAPLPKTKPAPKKVVQTMEATLKAKDKVLERIARTDKLVIAEQSRPQKVRVVVNSKTSIMVYPNEVENAIQRYNQRYRQSQEQSHIHQRKTVAKPKQKEPQSDLIFFH
jgi:hypothetical protein